MAKKNRNDKEERQNEQTIQKTAAQQRISLFATGFVLLLVIIGVLVFRYLQTSSNNATYANVVGEMRMLSQRLAKASSLAVQGDNNAFTQLSDSHTKFGAYLNAVRFGGNIGGLEVHAAPDAFSSQIETLANQWAKLEKDASLLLNSRTKLVELSKNVDTIEKQNTNVLKESENLTRLKIQSGAGPKEINAVSNLSTLSQKMIKNALKLRISYELDPEIAYALGKDALHFDETLTDIQKGNASKGLIGTADAGSLRQIQILSALYKDFRGAVNAILEDMQPLRLAKQAGTRITNESETLLNNVDALSNAFQSKLGGSATYLILLFALSIGAVALLGLLIYSYFMDSTRRAQEAEDARERTFEESKVTQDAILRLMGELDDLANGDLTVTATVSEDLTGTIADAINFTVEELRSLVRHINDATVKLTQSTEIANANSAELLEASKKQALELKDAGESVTKMSSSMVRVSDHADRAVEVANQSMRAAEKGSNATHNSIQGMNEIRTQIQETSKRIKRLGESSQEIGEIVELISDITEQTNVLALNAAIQAASAGDAGRGFSVVAEEVQRLAERSAEATKQIATIVKTIQADTQNAVSAMEQTTQGVLEGNRLADEAGKSLEEIGRVSTQLAHLIGNISKATRDQSESATKVANQMKEILNVTEKTSEGTMRASQAVSELTDLASELKDSVAGFKVE